MKNKITKPLDLEKVPEMHSVESSNIDAVGYDKDNEIGFIRFHGGGVYAYLGVSQDEFERLKNADSVGKHFWKFWRHVYLYKKLDPKDFDLSSKFKKLLRK